MLDRRGFVAAGSAAAACLGSRKARAASAKSSQLRLAYLISANSHTGAGATAMAEEVARRTDGRITIQQFPDAALGGELEVIQGMQIGAIDIAFITGVALGSVVPDAGIFNIPFLFNGAAHARAVFDGKIGSEYLAMFAAKDLVPLGWAENGVRHFTNSRHPIVTPEDLKGLKLRVPQSEVMLTGFRALGAQPTALPFPQLYSALEAGVMDGEENPIATILSANFARVQRFLTLSAHVYDPMLIIMSPDSYDDLTEADRAIVREAAHTGVAATRSFNSNAEKTGIATLQQAGMQVVSGIDRGRFVAAMADATAVYDKQFGRARIDQIRAVA